MVSKNHRGLGELELTVLKIVWEHQPCNVQEVADLLGERHDYARTTVLTVMQRLHAKRFLKRRKRDGVFRYSTTEERSEVMSRLIGQFVEKVLDGSPAPFVAYLAESNGLTDEQAEKLRAMVQEMQKKPGEEEE